LKVKGQKPSAYGGEPLSLVEHQPTRQRSSVPSVTAGMCHVAQPLAPVATTLPPTGGKSREANVMAIFLLVPGLVFALAAAGMVWIRLAAAEYRHRWSVPRDASRGAYPRR
jgi:hypothetical protein